MADKNDPLIQATGGRAEPQTLTLQQALDLAVKHHTAGELRRAEILYNQILQADPNQPQALHLLGVIAHQGGENERAVKLIAKALAIQPDYAEAACNLGLVEKERGNLEEAITSYQKAITLKPNYAEAHYNLGNVFKETGQFAEAVVSYQKAVSLKADYAEAHNNLGIANLELGRPEEAIANYRRVIALNPEFAEGYNNLGRIFMKFGRYGEAVASYQEALTIEPNYPEAHYNLGVVQREIGNFDEAITSYQNAIALNSKYAEAYNSLGILQFEMGKLEEAVTSYEKAVSFKPDYGNAYNNLGVVLKEQGRIEEAAISFSKALKLNPDHSDAHNNLGVFYKELGRSKEAIDHFRKSTSINSETDTAGRNLLAVVISLPGLSQEERFFEHLLFSKQHTKEIPCNNIVFSNDPAPDRRLRVGYLSSDFRDHPVGLNILPIFYSADETEYDVYCYADVRRSDLVTEKLRTSADQWRSITGLSDAEVATMVRADEIDVLVCLAGRFDANRPLVCAYRAAPVQVSFHDGATSGLQEMDYWLTDHFLNPTDTTELFTEQLQRLPVFYQYPHIEGAPQVAPPPSEQNGFTTFGSFNNPAKVNKEVIELWSEILNTVSGSCLVLKYKNWYNQKSVYDSVIDRFAAHGIRQDQIKFAVKLDTMHEHLDYYSEVDIALDPFPFNGPTTTFQALWMGVPVVALAGDTFISRGASSILHHSGLEELIAETPEAYVACAQNLAKDATRLKTLRSTLRERIIASPLCDAPAYALTINTAYRNMWQRWSAKARGILTV